MDFPPELVCYRHGKGLVAEGGQGANAPAFLVCPLGCRFPVVNGLPRFVASAMYTSAFGLQWKTFQKTQLDSYTGTTISRDRLARCLGGSLDIVRGKSVLEAGCGAGRFTEVLLSAGARVFACDLSEAAEASYANCGHWSDYFVCQADILQLPVLPRSFDIVVCLGVIQHTPNPEEIMTALCSYVKPGGLLVIDHYTHGYPTTPSRRVLRSFLLKRSKTFSMRFCKVLVAVLWPIHKMVWNMKGMRGFGRVRSKFLYWSPVVDYHDAYYQLGSQLLYEWAVLDTHDTLTDYYKHLRSAEEITSCLRECGMTDIETAYAGNGVEARARKPARPE
ncbi:MAG: class I SAM-dependent methyltransferase [Chloroflexi bacterium]|nr:class I SAM-dependent methyltransferase [Chloroflexota bacterium]